MDIKVYGAEVLRETAVPVENIDSNITETAKEMLEKMYSSDGIGLAAPQVGLGLRMFVCDAPGDKPRVFINPEIISTSADTVSMEEGCLSVPGSYGSVVRAREISMQAFDENGKPFRVNAKGMLARVIQHEYDHLDGKLFIDYLAERKREKIIKKMEKGQKR